MKRSETKESRYRSIMKSISFRIIATTATILIFYTFTGKLMLSLGAGAVETVVKLILYYLHERAWARVPIK